MLEVEGVELLADALHDGAAVHAPVLAGLVILGDALLLFLGLLRSDNALLS